MLESLGPKKSSPEKTSESEEVRLRLDSCFREFPQFSGVIERRLKLELFERGEITAQEIEEQAKIELNMPGLQTDPDPNQLDLGLWNTHLKVRVREITLGHVCQSFSLTEVETIIDQEVAREDIPLLQDIAWSPTVTFKSLRDCLESKDVETSLPPAERIGATVRIIRHTLSDHERFIEIAKKHLTIPDFRDVIGRTIGSEFGMGKVGGKAAGIILARSILTPALDKAPSFMPLAFPETYYLRSDVIEDFINLNKFKDFRSKKYLPIEALKDQEQANKRAFVEGEFPLAIVAALRTVLEKIGTHPIIVRSSSLLEDRLGAAFSGKYESIFLGNQGPIEQRIKELLRSIATIYSGIWSPNVIDYRRQKNLIDYEEDMAIIIQKVVGRQVGKYFMPAFAGVAFGRNEYSWSPRIKREDGLVRMVIGLGTQAVDRVGSCCPRMVPLGAPTLRPEAEQQIFGKSQKMIAVIDLE